MEKREVVIGRNVRFDENLLFKDLVVCVSLRPTLNKLEETSEPVSTSEQSLSADDETESTYGIPGSTSIPESRRSDRKRKPPSYLNDYEVSMNVCEALLCESNAAESDDRWKDAKIAELNSMKKHDVWTLVNKQQDKKIIRSHWVLRQKENGTLKARLVASGWD